MSQQAVDTAHGDQSVWATLREAVRGSHLDYTTAPIGRAVVLLAVPMVLEMMMESVFAVADIFFVARLGADAVATVGLTESLMFTVYAMAIGISIGAAATVARRIGEKDPDRAAGAAVQAIILGLGVAVVLGLVGASFGPQLIAAMGASDSVLATGSTFSRVMLGGCGTVTLLFLINAIFRGAGDAAIAMRVLWFANTINIVLGPCLIFGLGPFPQMGVTGAATATTIGRGCGVLYQLYHLTRPGGRLQIGKKHLALDVPAMRSILRISGTATFQNFVGTASWTGLIKILSGFGSAAVAGNTIGIRIVLFALLPSFGVSNAAATLVGQNLGAGRPDRAEAAAWKAGLYNTMCLGGVGIAFLVFAPLLISIFTSDPEVAQYGIRCLRIVAGGFFFYGYGMVLTQAFNGAGDTRTPTWINLACLWLWELPLAWALAHPAGLGPTGVFVAVSVAFSTLALVSAWLFSKGTWKTKQV
jgi:putative MATE family efflux protein